VEAIIRSLLDNQIITAKTGLNLETVKKLSII